MSKLQAQQRPAYRQREGEGVSVSVSVSKTPRPGESILANIDLSELPVPARRFAADACDVIVEPAMIRVLLGQTEPVLGGLLSLLIINMSNEAVITFHDCIDSNFRMLLADSGVVKGSLKKFSVKAEQSAVLTSTMVYVGYTGNDSCLDFYYSSPFSAQGLQYTKKLAVEPIVRVNLPTGLMAALVDTISTVAVALKSMGSGK